MNNYKEASRRAFDRQAADYDTGRYGSHARKLYPLLLAQLGEIPHGWVLDLGCGTGALLEQVLERYPGSVCTGLDLSQGMLERAEARLEGRARLIRGDAEALPFDTGVFDAVLCCDSFHHYPDPGAVVREVARVLRPGGVFLLADCTAPTLLRGVANWLLPMGNGGDVRLYSSQEMTALLEGSLCGVECRRVDATGLFAWGVRAPGP